MEHGFARVRCGTCRAEFLVAFRCKGRHVCPSCHARRLAEWSVWLGEHLLVAVAHRQVVLTVPKRLRGYLICDRRRLGLLSAVRTRHRRVPRGGESRILAFVTEPAVVRRILLHLERRGVEARAGPWAGAAAVPG